MDAKKNGQELAFPFVETREMQGESISFGLTKREHFAAMAMQGILANRGMIDQPDRASVKWVAERAIASADALLRALSTPPKGP